MARILCKCGKELSNSTSPEIQLNIITNDNWFQILERTDAGEQFVNFGEGLSIESWKCTACERLIVFRHGFDKPARIYKVEESDGEKW